MCALNEFNNEMKSKLRDSLKEQKFCRFMVSQTCITGNQRILVVFAIQRSHVGWM